jgi:hypothetical protein
VRILLILLKAARVGHNRIHGFTDEQRGADDITLRPFRKDGVRTTDPNDSVQDLSRVQGAAKFRPGWYKRYDRNPPIDTSTIGRIKIGLD